MKIRYWPLIYSLLLDAGNLLMQTNAQALALEALALVLKAPGSDYETKERARRQLDQWQSQLSAEDVEVNRELRVLEDTESFLQQILAEVSVVA